MSLLLAGARLHQPSGGGEISQLLLLLLLPLLLLLLLLLPLLLPSRVRSALASP